jgi:hypothetical protein
MNRPENNEPVSGGNSAQGADNERGDHFAAPLGSITGGRLEFVRGTANLTLRTDHATANLYHARFEGPEPRVRAEAGAVTIDYPRTFHPFDWRTRAAEVTLNGSIPWEIGVRGGASRLDADLRGLRLGSFEVSGGASRVELKLPKPSGTVPIRIAGGASNVAIRRPKGVAARVRVGGGATKLSLDEQRFGAIGGEVRLESTDYATAVPRYEIEVQGGANNLSVGTL